LEAPSVQSLIQQRVSWRKYLPEPLTPATRNAVRDILAELPATPFPASLRFHLLERQPGVPVKIGTYGTISGAPAFLIGTVKKGEFDLESFAFALESLILRLTGLGLGTCWLGGFFQRGDFARHIGARPDERLPAITPVGYPPPRRGVRDSLARGGARSKWRRPWSELFFLGDWATPLALGSAGPYGRVLEMVRLGPSASNRQPWRILKDPDRPCFHLFLKRNPLYGKLGRVVLGAEDLQRLDMGIAMSHFELSAREIGLAGAWREQAPALSLPESTEYVATWIGA